MEYELTRPEAYLFFALLGAGIGLILGLIPLMMGIRRGHKKLGIAGLVVTILAGALSPFAAIVSAVIFVIVLVRKRPAV